MIAYGTDYPDPLAGNGAGLLDDVLAWLRDYVAFPSDEAAVAVTLWVAHTHMVGAFDSTPRLALLSPEKQCGKTRVLELVELLAAGAERLSDASPSYMFRRIGAASVTVLLDEADAIWKRGKSDESAEALRSIVNAGHRQGSFVGRVEMVGQTAELRRHTVYAPVALAGIGDCLPDTILDRSIIVAMRRRAPDEQVRGFRERTSRPEGEDLRDRLTDWAKTVVDKVGCPWPEMPPGVADRPADVWEPLLMVANLAGGDWPTLARGACTAFVTGAKDETASIGVRLLSELRDVFGDEDAMWTDTILGKLHAIEEAPWGDWYGRQFSPRDLSKMLKPYGVKPRLIRLGETVARGYRREDLRDAWDRYLPTPEIGVTSATDVTPQVSMTSDVTAVTPVTLPDGVGRGVCRICDEPLDPVHADVGTHPNCEEITT